MDYYELLGVSRSASDAEIKRAYRRLSFAYHPDKNPDPEVATLYKQINEAYDVLSDPGKRRTYDMRGAFQFDIEPPQQKPRHRDPRYRPRAQRPVDTGGYSMQEVMSISMKYLRWVNWVALVFMLLFFLDYVIPTHEQTHTMSTLSCNHVSTSRGHYDRCLVKTVEGAKFNINGGGGLRRGDVFNDKISPMFSRVMAVKLAGETEWNETTSVYGGAIIFPVGLLLSSALGLFFQQRRLSLAINLSIISCMFLLITLVLIKLV